MRRMNSALSGWQRVELEDWILELDKTIRLVNNHLEKMGVFCLDFDRTWIYGGLFLGVSWM